MANTPCLEWLCEVVGANCRQAVQVRCASHLLFPLFQGTHKSLKGNSHALATVTAIIDGTGSVGEWIFLALRG